YRLTPAGRRAVRAWLSTPPEPPLLRHPVALRVFFGHLLDPDDLRAAVGAHRRWRDALLEQRGAVRAGPGDEETWRHGANAGAWATTGASGPRSTPSTPASPPGRRGGRTARRPTASRGSARGRPRRARSPSDAEGGAPPPGVTNTNMCS